MSNIFESASKLVLLFAVGVSGAAFLWGKLEPELWMVIVGPILGYYFGSRDPNVTPAKAKLD